MSVEIKVPEVGESIKEVQIGDWLKSEGEHVDRDEDVVVIETDKATVELAAPESGTLTKVLKRTGETATVGEIIAYVEAGEANIKRPDTNETRTAPAVSGAETPKPQPEAKNKIQSGGASEQARAQKRDEQAENTREAKAEGEATISTSFLAPSNGGQEEQKQAGSSGPESGQEGIGREAADQPELLTPPAEQTPETRTHQSSPDELAAKPELKGESKNPALEHRREEKIIPMTPIRRRIAEHLVQAKQTTAYLTTFNEIDMSAVKSLREQNQESFREKHQIKLGYMSFFVKATIAALELIPQVNAEVRGTDLVFRNYYDIGVAVGGGKGLVVPVLRNAQFMSFSEIEKSIADFARRAESNRLKPQELEGGTFTISNGGIYGSLLSTPILNFPQSGILGLHAIQDRPVALNGEVVIRPMMYVALTYDHRIVDGREAVRFLKRIKECIEEPFRLLLEA